MPCLDTKEIYKMKFRNKIISLRFVNTWGGGARFRIIGNNDSQLIFLPKSCVVLKNPDVIAEQDWFWLKERNQHKLRFSELSWKEYNLRKSRADLKHSEE